MNQKNNNNMQDDYNLDNQIGDLGAISGQPLRADLGKINVGQQEELTDEEKDKFANFMKKSSMLAQQNNPSISEGWFPIDRKELGFRAQFYPSDWEFSVRPATLEAVKNWSSIDEDNPAITNKVFNDIMKQCVSIMSNNGKLPWSKINSWDRFWFILKIHDYTFKNGEAKLNYSEECPFCDHDVCFDLKPKNLDYEFPDETVIEKHYSFDDRCWIINPKDYQLDRPVQKLYVPTLEKDDAILQWAIRQNNAGKQLNETFLRFLPWLLAKAPKDENVLEKFIKEAKRIFDSWDMDLFNFMDEVLRNVQLTPSEKLKTICLNCGEEVRSAVQFQNGIKSLFTIQSKHTKFGTK